MTGRVTSLWRHPIKAIGRESLDAVDLTPHAVVPGDRSWAVTHAASKINDAPEAWAHKMNFLRGVTGPDLMAVEAESGNDGIRLKHPRQGSIDIDLKAPDQAALVAWLLPLWPEDKPLPRALVQAPGVALTDVPDPWISILNMSSLRALEGRAKAELSIHRWRGNIWLDGLGPWEEFEWIGRRLQIGSATLEVKERITRCKATMANPVTGRRDVDTLGAIEAGWDHTDFGIYAEVVAGGRVAVGDSVDRL